jgi:hypothetical protein
MKRMLWLALVVVLAGVAGFAGYRKWADRDIFEVDAERQLRLRERKLETVRSESLDWPGWRGERRDGVYPRSIAGRWPEQGPAELWRKRVGPSYASIAVAEGRAYVLGRDAETPSHETLLCLDAATGEERWRYSYVAEYRIDYDSIPRSTPMVAEGHVYTVGGSGVMHCLKAGPEQASPEVVWRVDLLAKFKAKLPSWGVAFSPLVHEGLVFVVPGGTEENSIAALDARTGEVRWRKLDDAAGYSSPVLATLAGRTQVVFLTARNLLGVEPKTGEVLWRYPWVTDFDVNAATPIVAGDYVFVSSGYRHGCAVVEIERRGDGFEATQVSRHTQMQNHFSTCVFHKGWLYGFHDTFLTCIDFRGDRDKVVAWKERGFAKGSLLLAGDDLVVLGEYGEAALIEANHERMVRKAQWRFSTEKCWSMPALAQGRLYLRDRNHVACFDVK